MLHIKKPSPTPKEGEGPFITKLRKRGILKTLAAFVGGGVVAIEFAFHILVHHYHFPRQTVDIIIVTLVVALLCVVTWQWFRGVEKTRKFKWEWILISAFIFIGGSLNVFQVKQIGRGKLTEFKEYKTQEWENSIAVLPFENMSGDPHQEYFCDGLTEDLITALSHIVDLKVVARTSVFAFKGKQDDIRKIGEDLNVRNVVEGSVRKSGDQLRITAQLIDVGSGFHLWSGRFDRDMDNIFAIQDEISMAIVDALSLKLLGQDRPEVTKHETANPEAYDNFLRGRFYVNNKSDSNLKLAIEYFEKAIEVDPTFALAYTGLAHAYGLLPAFGTVSASEANRKAKEYAMKALALDDTLAETHALAGDVKIIENDWEGAEKDYLHAIKLNPGYAPTYNKYGYNLMCLARFEESVRMMKKAIELDPYNLNYTRNFGRIFYFEGRYEDAVRVLRETLAINPKFTVVQMTLGLVYLEQTLYEDALEAIKKEEEAQGELNPVLESITGIIYQRMGQMDKAFTILENLRERSEEVYISSYYLAALNLALGETDRGFALLDKAFKDGDFWVRELKIDPLFKDVRSDSRFDIILKKLRLK
jgi:adenylate cyclase